MFIIHCGIEVEALQAPLSSFTRNVFSFLHARELFTFIPALNMVTAVTVLIMAFVVGALERYLFTDKNEKTKLGTILYRGFIYYAGYQYQSHTL